MYRPPSVIESPGQSSLWKEWKNTLDDDDPNYYETPTYTTEIVQITHTPEKGIGAWLAHLQRKERRSGVFQYLRSLLY